MTSEMDAKKISVSPDKNIPRLSEAPSTGTTVIWVPKVLLNHSAVVASPSVIPAAWAETRTGLDLAYSIKLSISENRVSLERIAMTL